MLLRHSARLALLAVIVAATMAYQPRVTQAQTANLTIGIVTWGGNGQAFIAKEKGYWPNLHVDIKVLDDAKVRQAAFAQGDLEIMISSVDLFAQEAASGISGQIITVTDVSNGGDGIITKSSLKNVSDLKGQKVAVTLGAPSEYLLQVALKKAALSMTNVRVVNAEDPGKAGELFLSGTVDAAVTWEPFLTQATQGGGHILATSRDYPNTIVDLLIGGPKLLKNEKMLAEFLGGWMKATEFMATDHRQAVDIIANGFGAKTEDVEGMLAGIKLGTQDVNREFFTGALPADTPLAVIFNDASDYWVSTRRISAKQKADDRISIAAKKYFTQH